jgi:hypothetical protein
MEEVVRIEVDPDSGMETIYTCGPEDFEAYAELIVKECAEIANAGIDPAESHLIGNDILEHFGVEESLTKGEWR